MKQRSPVLWARLGLVSRVIVRLLRPLDPPILILSLPRSGSSWVGDMLGSANDALYLREPITQSHPVTNPWIDVDPYEVPPLEPTHRRLADKAFAGRPAFDPTVVRIPSQWKLHRRLKSRVVLKEVNPRACRWFIDRYHPRIVYLLRHPAAVSSSAQRVGWLGSTQAEWAERGHFDARTTLATCKLLEDYPESRTVFYEALCENPIEEFKQLYEFSGFLWTEWEERRTQEFSTRARARISAWRQEAAPQLVAALRNAYFQYPLPWYRTDEDW
jgi:hypothetical protein